MSKSPKIHPAADLFPMMTDDELSELAADITGNGLLHPIVVDDQGQIVDGRNRLAACRIAGIEPKFEQLNGRDPLAYIVSANLARRNLTKGQQAMALAMLYPEPEKGGRGKKAPETSGFSRQRLGAARSVLRQSRDLAESVIRGSVSLDEALAQVETTRVQAASTDAKLARLREQAPDLEARVAEENISLNEAMAILNQRENDIRRAREAAREAAKSIHEFSSHVALIHSGIDAGEDIVIPSDILKTLQAALELLLNDMRHHCHEKRKV